MDFEKKIIVHVSAFLKNKNNRYLFLKRSKESSFAPSTFDLPGGKMEWGEHPLDTLQRELMEEIGIAASKINFVGMQVKNVTLKGIAYHILKIYYSGLIDGHIQLSDEHQSFEWFELNDITKNDSIDADLKKFIKDEL